jgi:hypothetical protein
VVCVSELNFLGLNLFDEVLGNMNGSNLYNKQAVEYGKQYL